MSVLVLGGGITKLSELDIDADKDWQARGISNIKQVASGMAVGHILQHNGSVLESLHPGPANYVLTSQGPGHLAVWGPGGLFFNRYFPVTVGLLKSSGSFAPDKTKAINMPLGTLIRKDGDSLVHRLTPAIALARSSGIFTPDRTDSQNAAINRVLGITIPMTGAALDDGGVVTDYTVQQKSGPVKDQSYTAGEDGVKSLGAANWESQTFTTTQAGLRRHIVLKLYRSTGYWPGTVTVSIKAADGSGHPTGVDLCSVTFDGNYLTDVSPGVYYKIPFTIISSLAAATKYAAVVRSTAAGLNWRADVSSPAYAGGNREYSSNSGSTWTTDNAADFMFEEYYTVNDVPLLPAAPLAINDAFHWGHGSQFDAIIQDIGLAGAGTYVLAYEYSKGAGVWAACAGLVDGTNKFQNLYANVITHAKQADWAQDTVSGKLRYWIRARVTDAGAGYSQPLGTFAQVQINS